MLYKNISLHNNKLPGKRIFHKLDDLISKKLCHNSILILNQDHNDIYGEILVLENKPEYISFTDYKNITQSLLLTAHSFKILQALGAKTFCQTNYYHLPQKLEQQTKITELTNVITQRENNFHPTALPKIEEKVQTLFNFIQNTARYNPITYCHGHLTEQKKEIVIKNTYTRNDYLSSNLQEILQLVIFSQHHTQTAYYNNTTPADIDFLKKVSFLKNPPNDNLADIFTGRINKETLDKFKKHPELFIN